MPKRTDISIAVALGVAAVITRLPFLEPGPFYTDSIHVLKGITETGVAHPPGYIGYVMSARVLSWATGSPHSAILVFNLLATFVIGFCLYLLGLSMPGATRRSSALMAALFMANIFAFYYGEVSLSFIAEGMTATVTALLCREVIAGKRWAVYASAAALALGASIRQTLLVFLLPLWVGVCLFGFLPQYLKSGTSPGARSIRPLILGIVIMVPLVLLWMIPTVILYEPLGGYRENFDRQMAEAVWANSIFIKGFSGLAKNGAKLFFTIFFGMNFAVLLYLTKPMRQYMKRLWTDERGLPLFLAIWIIPSFLFYLFIFMGPPGYIFVFLPALYLPLAGGLGGKPIKWAVAAAALSAILFLAPRPLPENVRRNRLINVIVLKYNATGIAQRNSRNLGHLDNKLPLDYGGGSDLYKQ